MLNSEDFGYLMKPSDHTHSSLQEQADSFINFKLKTLGELIHVSHGHTHMHIHTHTHSHTHTHTLQ